MPLAACLLPGRQDEAPIREPGDLPSGLVDATNTGRGVPVDDPKDKSFGPRSRRRSWFDFDARSFASRFGLH